MKISFEKDMAIDLGSSTTLIYEDGRGVIRREPSVITMDRFTQKLHKVGVDAQKSLGRTPASIIALRPVEGGAICDYEMATLMLKDIMSKDSGASFLKPRVLACVHSTVSGVEERAVIDAVIESGARRVYLVEAPIAIAAGAGIDAEKPNGHMIIDIGGGVTEVAVVASGHVIEAEAVKGGGRAFDEAIVKYLRKKYDLLIGLNRAEELKRNIGAVKHRSDTDSEEVKGRDLKNPEAKTVVVTSDELVEALQEPMAKIIEAVRNVIEKCSPNIVDDIDTNGIIMAGGGSQLYGIADVIEEITKTRTFVVDDPVSCAIYGAGKLLKTLESREDGPINFYRQRQLNEQ